MKIAITSLYLPSGSKIGVGYQVHYLANELVRRGHDVTVFSQYGPSDNSLYKVKVVHPGKRLRTFGFAWSLRKEDFSGFDVLHACGDDWFLWGCRRPRHIHTYMGSLFAEMLHAQGLAAKTRMAALALCEYSSCFLANDLVAISKATTRHIPMVKKVIPCGVDTSAFSPATEKSPNPSILFVGTMHSRKRGNLLMDIFQNQIKPQIPEAELWIVREETPQTGDGVKWFGRLSTEDLAELFRTAWVFCLPSTYEGFGVPYIEAMASGTAVVASPNLGALEVTCKGTYGAVPEDEKLAETLLELLQNPEERKRYEAAGLKRAQVYTWDFICQQYEALYQGLPLPENPGGSP